MNKKLYKSNKDILISGVCGGIGEYFNVDSNIIRLIFVVFGVFGAGVIVYILLWIFLPYSDKSNVNTNSDSKIFDMNKENDVFKVITQNNNSGLFAVIAIIVGVLFLLNNFFHIFYYLNLSRIWPIILIVVGFVLILKKNKNN